MTTLGVGGIVSLARGGLNLLEDLPNLFPRAQQITLILGLRPSILQ